MIPALLRGRRTGSDFTVQVFTLLLPTSGGIPHLTGGFDTLQKHSDIISELDGGDERDSIYI